MFLWFDSLHLCLVAGPLTVYLLIIGCLNLRRRMTLLSGFGDTLLLGFAVSGFVIVGPVELFFPETAAFNLGSWVWVLLIALYALFVLLMALSQRPRLVFYNSQLDEVNGLIEQAATQVDRETRRLKNYLILPSCALQLHASRSPLFPTVQLDSLGEEHHLPAWGALRKHVIALASHRASSPTLTGYTLVVLSAIGLAMLGILSVADQHEIARAFGEMLRRD